VPRIDHFATIRRRKDGSLLNVSVTISPVRNARGEIIGASKVARDITDTVRAHEKLEAIVAERTAHLQATIGELERFSYSLSHDMRAPLRAIHSFLQIVLDEAGPPLTEQERDFLQKSVNASRRLDCLVRMSSPIRKSRAIPSNFLP
jgi:light-regulated signal transduction histidine kinase (bacteriophytochrome)